MFDNDFLEIDSEVVQDWIKHDICEKTKKDLESLLKKAKNGDKEAAEYINDAFKKTLTFGTAGLRGEMGPGPNRMNHVVVAKAAKGIANFLQEKLSENYKVVVGYDGRHNSEEYAYLTARIIQASHGKAILLPGPLPTPVAVYASKTCEADATIVVTASHNPAKDNGYKVYLGEKLVGKDAGGAQIVSPLDKEIYNHILRSPNADEIQQADGYEILPQNIMSDYVREIFEKSLELTPSKSKKDLRIVTTALHGVGGRTLNTALYKSGFKYVWNVEEQYYADPDFPTLQFPNPEEEGALDLAIALAKRKNADIILANDPDADRCSVAIKTPRGYKQLNGDEIGCLLGNIVASQNKHSDVYIANSIVSSRLLGRIAQSHNVKHVETLTGFKWIARVPKLVYGYEEAIGFCLNPDLVRDKDGISACLTIARYADALKDHDKTLQDILDIFALKFGLYTTSQLSIRLDDEELFENALDQLKYNPPKYLADSKVVRVEDLSHPTSGLPPTVGYCFYTAVNDRVIVRPSGTEPKLKCYIETIIPAEIVAPAYFGMQDMRNPATQAAGRIERIKADIRRAMGL